MGQCEDLSHFNTGQTVMAGATGSEHLAKLVAFLKKDNQRTVTGSWAPKALF